jgi:phage shock protein PspC (stress-responsive transcriptional regulator)
MSLADELQKLQTLREQGALTDDEFTQAKKRLLDGTSDEGPPGTGRSNDAQSVLRKFRRSLTDRWIGGVCGGLGELSGAPSWTWRILFLLTAFLHGLGIVMYVLLWIFVPVRTANTPQPAIAPPRE